EPEPAVFGRARAKVDRAQINRARPRHYGIGLGPQSQQKLPIPAGAERNEFAAGGRELAVHGGGNVYKNERKHFILAQIVFAETPLRRNDFTRPSRRWREGADISLGSIWFSEVKAVCAPIPHPPHSKMLARYSGVPGASAPCVRSDKPALL